jgi:hypothetical protein
MPKEEVKSGSNLSFYKPSQSTATPTPDTKQVTQLCQYVIDGNYAKAEAMAAAAPHLLLHTARVKSLAGTEYENAAYELALNAEDAKMAIMLRSHLIQIKQPDGKAEVLKQQQKQFLGGDQQVADMAALDKIFKAIRDCKATDDLDDIEKRCAGALQEFRDYLKPTSVIRTGKHFKSQMLLKAFELYEDKQRNEDFGKIDRSSPFYHNHGIPKGTFFWRKVIGSILRTSPANYAQAFSQGIYRIVEEKKPLQRSFRISGGHGEFFPLDIFNTNFRLGYEYAIDHRGVSADGLDVPRLLAGSPSPHQMLKTFIEQKQAEMQKIIEMSSQEPEISTSLSIRNA